MKIISVFFAFLFFLQNCSSPKPELSVEDTLSLLIFTSSRTTVTSGNGTDGATCTSNSQCATGFTCVSGFNLDQSTTTSRCKAIPATSGSIVINGTASTGTITSNSPLVDFDLTVTSGGNHIITAFTSTSTIDLVLELTNAAGVTLVTSTDTNTTGSSRERLKENLSVGSYRVRVKSYYVSGTFGGNVRVQVANNPSSVSSGGSCNFLANGNCYDFSVGSTHTSGLCSGGTYSATNSCATVNAGASPTISARCLFSINGSTANGQGLVTRVYYSAGTGVTSAVSYSTASGDCNSTTIDTLGRVIFQ
ncbi:serine-rich family protein [Leptospira limi]|uniref:Lipoprotein n=1 Tax=Leptospira limi TaxID=2950023 RepID=A0ABT3LSK9_9LEPT|nr:hypothetical protein [Leptospira limi]MCW7460711.1 hypothetical protein [Leptospira limi]